MSSAIMIIPARSGSKGVPGKNIKPLAGVPLIAHIINTAKKSKYIDDVYVSTDGNDIAKVSEQYGAKVVKRPPEIAGDFSASEDAVLHVLDALDEQGKLPEYTFFAQCTSPLTQAEDFDRAMESLQDNNLSSIFAAKTFHGFIWGEGENNTMRGLNHDHTGRRLMRQETPPQYQETGSFYLFKTTDFRKNKRRFFGNIGVCEIPEERSIDIDTLKDFEKVESLLKAEL
ncbi:MAG: cytidylyltransferase domain-containing protein [Alphaproteobacteria bacterium]